jgi:ABC-type multidrug transport system fused ATPase/permease subunit
MQNSVEIENLLEKFGIFFDEFSTGPFYKYLFYIIFFIRRLVLCIFVIFSHSGGFQIIVSLLFSFIVISTQVILFTKLSSCFKDRYFDKYFFSCELLIAVFYSCQGLFALNFISAKSLAVTGYSIVFIILFITIIFGSSSSLIKIWRTCRKSRKSTKVTPAKYEERENVNDHTISYNGLNSMNQKSEVSRHSGVEIEVRDLKRYFSFRFAPNASLRDSLEESVHVQ